MTLRQALKFARAAVHLERNGPDYILHANQDGQPFRWPLYAIGYRASNVARSIAILEVALHLLRHCEQIRLGLYWNALPDHITGRPPTAAPAPPKSSRRVKKTRGKKATRA